MIGHTHAVYVLGTQNTIEIVPIVERVQDRRLVGGAKGRTKITL